MTRYRNFTKASFICDMCNSIVKQYYIKAMSLSLFDITQAVAGALPAAAWQVKGAARASLGGT